jgi:hypothetical protein
VLHQRSAGLQQQRIASGARQQFDRQFTDKIVIEITGIDRRNCSASLNEDTQNPKVLHWLL